MQAHRAEAVVLAGGKVMLNDLPFAIGRKVQVIVLEEEGLTRAELLAKQAEVNSTAEKTKERDDEARLKYFMEGDPDLGPIGFNYDPTEPASEDEWPSDAR